MFTFTSSCLRIVQSCPHNFFNWALCYHRMTATQNGYQLYDSHQTLETPSLYLPDGTKLSKSGTLPTANWGPTTLVMVDTSTPSLSLPMVPFVPQVEKMVWLCFGILMMASICTPLIAGMSSMHCVSVLTDIGCVLQLDQALRSGYVFMNECFGGTFEGCLQY